MGSSVVFCCGVEESCSRFQCALPIAWVKVMRHIAKIFLWKTDGLTGFVCVTAPRRRASRFPRLANAARHGAPRGFVGTRKTCGASLRWTADGGCPYIGENIGGIRRTRTRGGRIFGW